MTDPLLAGDDDLPDRHQGAAAHFWRIALAIAALGGPVLWLALAEPQHMPDLGTVYLPLHIAMEIFSIVIASMIFALGWHNISDKIPCNVIILSAAFLAVALLDLCHLLSLEGMPDFVTPGSVPKAIAFALASRIVTAAALLVVALLPWSLYAGRRIRCIALAVSMASVALAAWVVLYRFDALPATFVQGQGVTLLKVRVEYALFALYTAAALLFLWRAWRRRDRNAGYLAVAAAIMAMSEVCFTWHAQPGELPGMLGHFYKVIAGGYLYWAIFLDALREPYQQLRRSEQSRLRQLTHDTLTGLPNRALIAQKLRQAIVHARLRNTMLAVFFLDVDFFKKVNATFGHGVGDEIIRACAGRLAPALTSDNTLARQAGDEFIILQENITDGHQAALLAENLLRRMREPFHIQGHEIFLSASVGITLFPDDETTENGLLHKAHMAMSSVKKDARNTYRFHTSDMERGLREQLMMESSLHHALDNGELMIHYQPKVNFSTGAVAGVEALVRWNHPVLGQVPPASFIPIAEENGCIDAIGMWVLEQACAQARKWQELSLPLLCVSVNLSARQFQQPRLAEQVGQVLRDTGLVPSCLELEITESTVMQDTEAAITALQSLKRLGVVLSVDDFGTGYSSLSCLKRFPIDVLKIDRSFVSDVTHDTNDAAITRAIIALAHGLDLAVVAEGVETLEQALFLQANGCDEMQGYYFSRPVLPDELADMLRADPVARNMDAAAGGAAPGA